MSQSRFLMCPPLHFGVEYVINPWMQGQIHATDQGRAAAQWSRLRELLSRHAEVVSLPPVAGLPDLVFTANAALVYRDTAVLSCFRCPERQPEAPHFAKWLQDAGFAVQTPPSNVLFEGAGDALLDRNKPFLWLGHGMRSDISAKEYIERFIDVEVQPLRLKDPNFYHLDTCFCPLEGGYLLYYPPAFDAESLAAIEARVPPDRRITVAQEDALQFACNAVNVGKKVVMNQASDELKAKLMECGFEVVTTPLTEFMRAGGAAKCLSLRLNEG
jgi:N-dimethylarginine dimethylaminohydrolase